MNTPFEARVPAVFVPVRDMERSIAWYSKLLGLTPPAEPNGEFHIFRLADQGANLFLERRDPVQASPHVLFSLPAAQIDQAHAFMQENGIEVVAFDRNPDGSTIQFKDPDGNVLMACDI
jgi:catechol 2,3-dioxygenase-like lactoylglutathione lyase family enzyme